jgi:hypothetical protein
MAVIKRGIGLTPTERNLAALADKIFLNLWSYPNLFKNDGKELCDLLVVCGDDVLIFSDKNVAWQKGNDFELSWSRWYRRAIVDSADQINGAARYLGEHPDELFLDATRKEKYPLVLPPRERRRTHHIAVALGAAEACSDYYKAPPGYFPINPDLKGQSHLDTTADGFMRFAIGDVQSEGAFVHVFNEPALELLARELDTVTDFTRYLTRRARIIRSGHLLPLAGEHDLLANYLLSGGRDEEHDFTRPGGGEWQEGEKLQIPGGTYAGLAAQPGYKARREADKVSYAWDNLLGQFTASILAGEAEGASGKEPKPAEVEEGLRSMALEPRLRRRLLGASVVDAIHRAEAARADHFARHMVPGAHSVDETVGYILLILAHHGEAPGDAYTKYRERRMAMLEGYSLNMLHDNRDLKRAIAIGIDASSKVTGREGGSEDFYALEVDTWTPELEKRAQELKKDFGLLKPDKVTHATASVDEFPRTQADDGLTPELQGQLPRQSVTAQSAAANIKARRVTVSIRPDAKWPNMWRLHLSNGQVSDMVNLTRARDAARSFARSG